MELKKNHYMVEDFSEFVLKIHSLFSLETWFRICFGNIRRKQNDPLGGERRSPPSTNKIIRTIFLYCRHRDDMMRPYTASMDVLKQMGGLGGAAPHLQIT